MRTVNQGKLIEKIIRFIEIDSKKTLSDAKKEGYRLGLCRGFSIVHAYMAAVNGLAWWNQTLDQIATWDETEKSLIENPALKDCLLRASHYVLFNQAGAHHNFISTLTQKNLLLPGGLFVSEKGPIQCYAHIAGNFSKTSLNMLIDENIFSGEGIFLIGSINHACALRYHDGYWYFYNPDTPEGEVRFENKNALIDKILGQDHARPLQLEIASWNLEIKSKTDELVQHFNELCAINPIELIQKQGLRILVCYAPNQFNQIIENAKKNNNLANEIMNSLFAIAQDGITVMYYLHQYEPRALQKILKLYDEKTQELLWLLSSMPSIIMPGNLEKMYQVINNVNENTPSIFLICLIKKISSTQELISIEKLDFLTKILEKINAVKHNPSHTLVIQKLKMIIVIEQYIASRVIEAYHFPKMINNLAREGIFKLLPNRKQDVTTKKLEEAEKLKAKILYSTDDPKKLSEMISASKNANKIITRKYGGFFHAKEGSYAVCLDECKKILSR